MMHPRKRLLCVWIEQIKVPIGLIIEVSFFFTSATINVNRRQAHQTTLVRESGIDNNMKLFKERSFKSVKAAGR